MMQELEINGRLWAEFPALEIKQPIGNFYLAVIPATTLYLTSFADVRRIVSREDDVLIGIQRPLHTGRIKELAEYVQNVDACFPTGIIVAASSEKAVFDDARSSMRVLKTGDTFKILDGQHRIAGLEFFSQQFEMPVVIFIDMDVEDQAHLFATINLKQTPIQKSLAHDLYEYATTRSPHKTAHDIVRIMNRREDSPLCRRVKILGVADGGSLEFLTQAALVELILPLVTRDARLDRDLLKRRKKVATYSGTELRDHPLRNLFVNENDAEVMRVIWDFLSAISNRWPVAWSSDERGMMLARTNGVIALLKFLRHLCGVKAIHDKSPGTDFFAQILAKVDLRDRDFNTTRFVPGSSGQAELLRILKSSLS